MDIEEQKERGAHALAARNVAIAMERFGYKPPAPRAQASRPAAPTPKPPPAVTPAPTPTVDPAELARLTAIAAVMERDRLATAKAADTKAMMRRVVDRINARAGFQPTDPELELTGWAKAIARINASANPRSAGRGPAPR